MDFFQRQEKARRNTVRLVFYFVLGVGLMLIAVYAVFAGVFRHAQFEKHGIEGLWDTGLFLWATITTLGIIAFGSLYKTIELSEGGSVVATALGGEPVDRNTRDPDLRKLLNVVEEMSIASGVPMPEVYVMPEEKGINAFAAGTAPDNAVIGVTDGCVRLLKRDELQGVIGHEFSHILNGDMRLNLRLVGIVFGLLCIMLVGRTLLDAMLRGGSRRRSSSDSKSNPLPLIMVAVALVVIGWLGAWFGRLIQAAVSRQREYLADASAVQFTRNPLGLAGALKKIGGLAYGSKLESARAAEASHMFFANGLRESWLGLTATHPPLGERIRLLDPSFDGRYPVVVADESRPAVERVFDERPPLQAMAPIAAPPEIQALMGLKAAANLATKPVRTEDVLQKFTPPTPQHLEFAANFKAGLPPRVLAACEDPLGAIALVFGLLLSADPNQRAAQLSAHSKHMDGAVFNELKKLDADLAGIDPEFKLPLALLALPALRRMASAQFLKFEEALNALVYADEQVDLFEYALQKIVLRHLDPHFNPPRRILTQYYALNRLLPECAVLLSALAHVGHQSPKEIQAAFQSGASLLPGGGAMALLPLAQCGLAEIDAALDKLNQAGFLQKRDVLIACARVVAADNAIQWREAELLRAIADALGCPVPPFISGV
jgi:Zn-dependent protease with chaperone function